MDFLDLGLPQRLPVQSETRLYTKFRDQSPFEALYPSGGFEQFPPIETGRRDCEFPGRCPKRIFRPKKISYPLPEKTADAGVCRLGEIKILIDTVEYFREVAFSRGSVIEQLHIIEFFRKSLGAWINGKIVPYWQSAGTRANFCNG